MGTRADRSRALLAGGIAAVLIVAPVLPVLAHEGHAPLPSNGATLDGRLLLVSPAAVKSIEMKLATITLGDMREVRSVNGRIELPFHQQAKVATLLSGRIETVLVTPGERVVAGQELARIESTELESQQAALLRSSSELALLQRLVEQRQGLVGRGALAASVLLQTQADLERKAAEHAIAGLRLEGWGIDAAMIADIESSQTAVSSLAIRSPRDGIIGPSTVRPGQLVQATDSLFEVVDLSQVYAVGEVPESDAASIAAGMSVTMRVAGVADREFTGTIDYVHMHLHEPQRSLHVVVLLDNADERLRPGMFGRMKIEIVNATQEIVCPLSALIENEDETYVLKREGEAKYARQPVRVGMRSRDMVVIRSGLFPGQQVVSQGTHLLAAMYDGPIAEPKKPAVTANAPAAMKRPRARQPIAATGATVTLPTNRQATATSLIEGRVAEIRVRPGQSVQAGDTLATVESPQLRDLQLEFLQAQSRLVWTEDEVRRLEPLAESGAFPLTEFWQRQTDAQTLRLDTASLARRLSLVGVSDEEIERLRNYRLVGPGAAPSDRSAPIIDRIVIRAPISGRISDVFLAPGELVHAHDKLFEVQDPEQVWIKAYVFEEDAARVQPGQMAVVSFPANPQLSLSGAIVHVGPRFTSEERLLPLWIELPNVDGFLKSGMLARVTIDAPAIPATAQRPSP